MKASRYGIGLRWGLLLAGCGLLMSITACRHEPVPQPQGRWVAPAEEDLTAVHLQLKAQEKQEIEAFVARRGRPLQQSGTGLYYDIYER
ncbi:MAG: hypothetical protein K2I84_05505, partial [Bacteroidales bacterium]|nr:hypothetical protein [Bacteroidales bacterium]